MSTFDWITLIVLALLLASNISHYRFNKKAMRILELYKDFLDGKIHHSDFRAKIYGEGLYGVEKMMISEIERQRKAETKGD